MFGILSAPPQSSERNFAISADLMERDDIACMDNQPCNEKAAYRQPRAYPGLKRTSQCAYLSLNGLNSCFCGTIALRAANRTVLLHVLSVRSSVLPYFSNDSIQCFLLVSLCDQFLVPQEFDELEAFSD